MAIGIRVGSITDEIGAPDFLHAFFSTISAHCDGGVWGSRFPHLFRLYTGHLPAADAGAALSELREARQLLSRLPPSRMVWDIEDRGAEPPWGHEIASDITHLGNYFVSSTGRDLFALFEEALDEASTTNRDAFIEQLR
jgi:hypothetical protein